ncbi:glycoside hydrolase family 5 protein [Mollisia scopiformis]|uniref:cellulase n=1 Tax=Mollisia scopiformis TaxID=149040 RepID=A0A194XMX3_MOLSC|nr:glycoside hydrolase family 5 protein [Mollisia scopiformis]KUJ21508.1 glycoside hydrolase family 5 protein [Mollisia scopiformis]
MLLFTLSLLITAAYAVSPLAGVNIAGFDFGVDITGTANLASADPPLTALGGSDGAAQMSHFAKQDSLNLFRLPVSWQFLINSQSLTGSANNGTMTNGTMGNATHTNSAAGALDATNSNNYDQLVQACLATGAHCIIDVHNYARFNNEIIGQGGPSNEEFANLWSQIAAKYKNETNIVFGIMNEPHNIPDMKIWAATVQAAVTAIRTAGATTQMILLPGNDFTGAQTFVSNGSAGNLSNVHNLDGSNTSLIFDVHKYLDADGSGQALDCSSNHITDTFMPLAMFLVANKRQAILSETGGGNSASCLTDLCNTLTFINANTDAYMGYVGWAAGGFSPTNYNLTMTPIGSAGNFTDQPIVKQCLVGTRMGGGIASKKRMVRKTL